MKIRTKEGIAEPLPLSDLQVFNRELVRKNKLEMIDIVIKIFFIISAIMIMYSYIQRCACL